MPYRDGLRDRSPRELREPSSAGDDVEIGQLKKEPTGISSVASGYTPVPGFAPVLPLDTPFFHLDLPGAVRAAESGLGKQ